MNITTPSNKELNLLLNYYNEGKLYDAEELALSISNEFPEHEYSWKVLGAIYQRQNRKKEALNANKKALNIAPNNAEILNNLGVTLSGLKEYKKAEEYFSKALLINSNYAEAYYNIANTLKKLGRLDQAEKNYYKAINLKPNFVLAYNNLGSTLKKLGRLDEAVTILNKALELKPDYADAYNNLGGVLLSKGLLNAAIKIFNHAISFYKKNRHNDKLVAASYNNKGLAYTGLNQFDQMRDNFLEALRYNKDIEFVYGFICYAKLYCADWNELDFYKAQALKNIKEEKKSTSPFCSFSITDDPAIQLKIATSIWDSSVETKYNKKNYFNNTKHTKPRVAYLSYDFHDHATMHLMAGVFEHQDHNKFDYYAFSYSDEPTNGSNVCKRVLNSFQNFELVTKKNDKEVCQILKDNEIDIVVDLKGNTFNTRIGLLSTRPCPIQLTFLGHPGTTGANFIDYIIADDFIVNTENEAFFSEKILKLPNCYQPADNKRYFPSTTLSKKQLGLPENKFIFCSFNSPYKIQPEMFYIWMEILGQKKDSVLWLLENENSESVKNILSYAEKKGINPNRIIYSKRCQINEYLERLKVADLFLDTFPITAHTTASDALWVGLPILTLAGKSMVSRVAGSLLNSANMKELITYNYDDYKKMALKLSNDKNYYNEVRSKLQRERLSSPLFNTKLYTENLESIYTKLYKDFKKSL
jgi:predicted O-linked N-acetylglucosamine transferase (SPINDLY family)